MKGRTIAAALLIACLVSAVFFDQSAAYSMKRCRCAKFCYKWEKFTGWCKWWPRRAICCYRGWGYGGFGGGYGGGYGGGFGGGYGGGFGGGYGGGFGGGYGGGMGGGYGGGFGGGYGGGYGYGGWGKKG